MSIAKEMEYEVMFVLIALILAYGLYHTVGLALATSIPVVAVTSGSMQPTLQRGDLIIVHGKPFKNIAVGDIIIYNTNYTAVPIIHRVIHRTSTTLETKGDHNINQVMFCDPRPNGRPYPSTGSCPNGKLVDVEKGITQNQVLGTAYFVIPEVGQLKLIPTCIYLRLTGQVGPNSLVCPGG